jgi:mannose-1-phosphate guanylyltransferase/mannose-1-phosphate guanylyltransferase/phosphomannomutase
MKAFILAAGKGTRLRPFTDALPKPLIPVLNRPVMANIISLCRTHGVTDFIANLCYKGEQIEQAFRDGNKFGVNLQFSWEEQLLGTAGGVRRQAPFLKDDTFVIVSGDVVTDIDLSQMLAFHRSRGALITMAVKEVDDPSRFGIVVTEETGRILSFQEKPASGKEKSRLANTGIYILEPEVLNSIPAGEVFDFGHDLFPKLLAMGAPIYAMRTDAYWSDVGTLPQYLVTHWDLLEQPDLLRERVGKDTIIEPGAVVSDRALIGNNCHIQSGAVVTGLSCISDGTVLTADARVANSVIWSMGKEPYTVSGPVICSIVGADQCVELDLLSSRLHEHTSRTAVARA